MTIVISEVTSEPAQCNLNYRIKPDSWKLPVMFNNLQGYDGHLIVKVLKKHHGKTSVIANNMETYRSFSAGQLQFLDSYQFTNMSLKKLVETLSPEEFGYTSKGFPNSNEFALVKPKVRLHETSLPSKDQFFNKLTDKHISRKQYQHDAQRVWDELSGRLPRYLSLK